MSESTNVKTRRDGQIAHAFTGGTYTVTKEPGDFTWDVPDSSVDLYLDRGLIGATPDIRCADEAPMTFGYSAYLTDLGDPAGAYISLADSIWRYTGDYADSTLTSTLSGTDVVTCTTTYTISGTAKSRVTCKARSIVSSRPRSRMAIRV